MSSGYALHPEAFTGLDEIRDFIAQRNPDAADRIMAEFFGTIRGLVPFPHPWSPPLRPQFAAFAVHSGP
jgi:plasmid stabilization system protein ParE